MEKKAPFKIELDKGGGQMEARLSDIPRDEVLRYLGYRGQNIGEDLDRQITDCITTVAGCAKPRLTYRILNVTSGHIDGLEFEGKDIKTLLSIYFTLACA